MKTPVKASLIVAALALLACLVWLVSRPGGPDAASVPDASRGPSFDVHVVPPRSALPLFGLLGFNPYGELRFGHASRGAQIGQVGHDRLELRADGWELLIETDGEGRIGPATRLVFPLLLAERQQTLRCRPADGAVGHLRAAERAGSGELDGSFLVELATCENAATGRVIEWPPAPLTLRGSFAGLPRGRR